MTEKKLAANRANARLARGPATLEGKERSSRNACKHHLYAKKFQLPPAWQARIWTVVEPCLAGIDDPLERAATLHYAVLNQWILELFAYETRLIDQSIARNRSVTRGVHDYAFHNPLFLAIEARRHSLWLQAERARREWLRSRAKIPVRQLIPKVIETKPLVMAAAAAISASNPVTASTYTPKPRQIEPSHSFHPISRQFPPTRNPELVPTRQFPHPNLINSKPIMGRFLLIHSAPRAIPSFGRIS